jgi:undecaprenyl-diphosphatase
VKFRPFWRSLDAAELPLLKAVERVRLGGPVDRATGVLTEIGEHGLAWQAIALTAAAADKPRRKQWLGVAAIVAGTYAVSTGIKLAAGRQRPPIAARGTISGLSFPSSHTATSFAAARAITAVEPRAEVPAYALAAAFAASRIHFCVHYPSDIAAGAALGDAIARATVPRVIRVDK